MNRPEIPLVQPLAPPFERFEALFRPCWESGQLSNMGPLHQELEATLARRLGAPLTLVSNGTLALVLALRALGLTDGEVVTTPFTFAATILAISLAGLTPKLADIDNETLCLSPLEAEKAITPETCAILPVHVFGRICDVASFDSLSREYGLKVVYDGAHAFDRREEGLPVAQYGDATAYSFHATKLFHTIEGGAVAIPRITQAHANAQLLRNFGMRGESVLLPGFNAKLSEAHCAAGLSVLPLVEEERARRRAIAQVYTGVLGGQEGIEIIFAPNAQYFALRLRPPFSRDAVYARLQSAGVGARRYFFPAACDYPAYAWRFTGQFPNARAAAKECLALPLYGALSPEKAHAIAAMVLQCRR